MKIQLSIFLSFFATLCLAQEFHVTTTGDDGASGSADQPWESIQHAMDNATPGSTVLIHGGTYNERLYMNIDGAPGNYTTFIAFNEEEVVVDGSGMSDYALLEMYDVQYVAVEGLRFKNNIQLDAVGILIEGISDHIRIEDCDISNIHFSADPNASIDSSTNAQALIVYGNEASHSITNLEIIDNEIFDCRLGYSEALAINGNVDGFVVSENEVHDVSNIGIDIIGHEGVCGDASLDQARNGIISDNETYNCLSPYATSAGIYVDGGKNLIIERNHVHHNQWGIEIGCENLGKTTDNVIVRNNFIYRNSTAGIHFGGYDYPSGSGKVTNGKILNNTLFGNDTEEDWSGEIYLSYNEGLSVKNNIFYADNSNGIFLSDENLASPSMDIVFQNNCWYHPSGNGNVEWAFEGAYYESLADFESGSGISSQSFFENPNLVSLGNSPDLHLSATSSATLINNGLSEDYGNKDVDGEVRVAGTSIDIGADEYDSFIGIAVFQKRKELSAYPNPTNDVLFLSCEEDIESIALYDLSGKLIVVQNTKQNQPIRLDLSAFQTGIYLAVCKYPGGMIQVSIAKQ